MSQNTIGKWSQLLLTVGFVACHFACVCLSGIFCLEYSFFPKNDVWSKFVFAAGMLEMILMFPIGYIALLSTDDYRIALGILGLNSGLWGWMFHRITWAK